MATANKSKDQLDAEDINRYWDAYFVTIDVLMDVSSKLQELEDGASDLGERSGYRADRLRTEANIELMRAKRIAFIGRTAAIRAPTDAEVQVIRDIADKVAAETVSRERAKAILKGSTDAMKKFSSIQT